MRHGGFANEKRENGEQTPLNTCNGFRNSSTTVNTAMTTMMADMRDARKGMFDQLTKQGYSVVHTSWEDTGRNKNSCIGPNITDQTLLVDNQLMSVVRRSGNFVDETCDVPIDKFKLRVGNETGAALIAKPLTDVLKEKGWFLPRDTHVLTSTQLCLLPLGKDGFKEFALRLYNYQSTMTDSALVVVVAASQGTSIAPILASRDRQIVYFNDNGTARPFEARRLKADREERKVADTGLLLSKDEKDRNQLLVFHVPLKVVRRTRGLPTACYTELYEGAAEMSAYNCGDECEEEDDTEECECEDVDDDVMEADKYECLDLDVGVSRGRGAVTKAIAAPPPGPKFDAAMLRVSARDAGKFSGLDASKTYERDPDLPIRCVVQTYAAIGPDDKELSPEAMVYIAEQLLNPYRQADSKGSLVIGTGTADRVTAMTQAPPLAAAAAELPSMMQT